MAIVTPVPINDGTLMQWL